LFQAILDLIYPVRCPVCGEIVVPKGEKICTPCKEALPYIHEPRCMKCSKPLEMEEKEYCSDCELSKASR
jgi:predicted nucleic acid-binding Zn ribbon protein